MSTPGFAALAATSSGPRPETKRLATRRREAARDIFAFWRALAILSLLLLGAMVLVSAAARAQDPGPTSPDARSFDDRPHGLLFRSEDGREGFLAPTLATEVRVAINGTVERVTVRQHFINPSNAWLEGVYIFPLPERAAVDHLVMQIGDRRIVGQIKERAEAQAIYEEAAASGQQASLVSQERPNIFTSSVANIGPGETVVVEIGYQGAVAVDHGRYSMRFPMVVAPRYMPGTTSFVGVDTGPDLERVPDADRIDGPVRDPVNGRINPLTLAIDLAPGFPLGDLASLYHPVSITEGDDGARRITLTEGAVPADRDFVLEWAPSGSAPRAAVFAETRGNDIHLLVTLTPPADLGTGLERLPRDIVFVIDTSGSMAGASIEQARAALSLALDRLSPGDRFNVIRFSDTTEALFPNLRPWSADSLRTAQAAVARLDADGGTEMQPALRLALDTSGDDATPAHTGGQRLRQVVFLTDAAVGNEAELFDDIAARLGDVRLFTIGIGSAPNSYFMRKAAELGRGSYTYIGDIAEVGERMKDVLGRLESPVLTGIAVAWPESLAGKVEAFPQPVPDLYRGEPVTFTTRLNGVTPEDLDGTVEVTATTAGGGSWSAHLPLAGLAEAPGVASVWARAKLEAIEDRQWRGADPSGVRAAALSHALAYDLVSSYTSLVAVDETIARTQDQTLHTAEIERNLPDGWVYEKVFGESAGTVDPAALPAPDTLMQRIALPQSLQQGQSLPATATPAELHLLFGAALLLLALASLMLGRRLGNLPSLNGRHRG
jgi:Ca-activated chloride channel family protein